MSQRQSTSPPEPAGGRSQGPDIVGRTPRNDKKTKHLSETLLRYIHSTQGVHERLAQGPGPTALPLLQAEAMSRYVEKLEKAIGG
ncbi:MAG: hypothetical protein M1839_008376 [Geoglossum umbratile]|nr:MAG: hypothetical protein M1839_008376 [Geoglossum umbratile]